MMLFALTKNRKMNIQAFFVYNMHYVNNSLKHQGSSRWFTATQLKKKKLSMGKDETLKL